MKLTEAQYERTQEGVAGAAWQREPEQPASVECSAVCCRTGLQMAWSAEALRPLAHHLYTDESVVQKRRS